MSKIKRGYLFTGAIFCFALLLSITNIAYGYTQDNDNDNNDDVSSISLASEGDTIKWDVSGYSARGFKVVWSKNINPTYPNRSGDKYLYYSNPNEDSTDDLTAFSGAGTYYVRVCEYLSGKCGIYSNEITMSLGSTEDENDDEHEDEKEVKRIELETEGNKVKWSVEGYSPKGFKVVWSKISGPTYPTRSGDRYHYFSNPKQETDTLKAFDGSGAYYVRVCEYLNGKCGVYSNEETINLTQEYEKKKKIIKHSDDDDDDQIKKIKSQAQNITENKFDLILAELQELRDLVKEQAAQIKYLNSLKEDVQALSSQMEDMVNNFITYGVDDNTQKLGAGERAAVMYSYKSAFGKLPEDESEFTDAIKIANGRWPDNRNEEAENKAKENFKTIYKREANMDNLNDNAAVTVMAYGLRQKAENRNLESEKNGIKIFVGIFGRNPADTDEWNMMQAITYSGSTR